MTIDLAQKEEIDPTVAKKVFVIFLINKNATQTFAQVACRRQEVKRKEKQIMKRGKTRRLFCMMPYLYHRHGLNVAQGRLSPSLPLIHKLFFFQFDLMKVRSWYRSLRCVFIRHAKIFFPATQQSVVSSFLKMNKKY